MNKSFWKKNLKKRLIAFFDVCRNVTDSGMVKMLIYYCNRLWSMYFNHGLCKKLYRVGQNVRFSFPTYIIGEKHISIGSNFDSGLRFRLEAIDNHLGVKFSPRIKFGSNISINHDCHIGAINEIVIEDGVLIASKVFITDHFHGDISSSALSLPPSERKLFSKGSVRIEKNVWIGEGVVILPNVTIGESSIIGANSVITKDVPKNSVVGGNPQRVIRYLHD